MNIHCRMRHLANLNPPVLLYKHDCPHCQLVGVDFAGGEDIYLCGPPGDRRLTRRYGDAPGSRLTLPERKWNLFDAQPEWRAAIRAARACPVPARGEGASTPPTC